MNLSANRKYPPLASGDQRQSYKDDFNAEYDEYRLLHARVESVTRRFSQLDAQCRKLVPGTKEYQVTERCSCSPGYRLCSTSSFPLLIQVYCLFVWFFFLQKMQEEVLKEYKKMKHVSDDLTQLSVIWVQASAFGR